MHYFKRILFINCIVIVLFSTTKGSTDDFIYNMADVNDDLKIGIDVVLFLMSNLSE